MKSQQDFYVTGSFCACEMLVTFIGCLLMDRRIEEARMAKRDRWYVLRMRAGFEALVISELRQRGIEVFLPSNTFHISRESDDSHILARFSLANQKKVSLVPGVLDLVGVPRPSPIPDRDVANLKAATDAGMTMKIL